MKEMHLICGFLLVESLLISGCFITNCPPGGKRSGLDTDIRQCEQCGPPGMNGLCYGTHICCSSEGCLFGTSETNSCLKENLMHNTPCQNPGEPCSGDEINPINGQCAAPGICCSTETCTMDNNCHNHGGKEEGDKTQNSLQINPTHLKENSHRGMFQNPLDRWIPRRFGLRNGANNGFLTNQKKPVHVIPQDIQYMAAENPFIDRVAGFPESGRIPNEEY